MPESENALFSASEFFNQLQQYILYETVYNFISYSLSYISAHGSSKKSSITYIPVVKFNFEIRCTCTLKL